MDLETKRSTVADVRRSIVRICFNWHPDKEDYEYMVIAGVIISINDQGAVIVADATFFKMEPSLTFTVNFPKAQGYEESINGCPFNIHEEFCVFTLKSKENGYIKPVKLETKPLNQGDAVNTFVFPREGYITRTSYPGGYVICVSKKVVFLGLKLHEYGYLGSPVFNRRGHLVAITYLDKGHLQAWTVSELQNGVLKNRNSILVSNGQNVEEAGDVAEPPMEE